MENNNGRGIFYGVIGVATLVVAIIGATFAYFSATITRNDAITNVGSTTLTLDIVNEKNNFRTDMIPVETDGNLTFDHDNSDTTDAITLFARYPGMTATAGAKGAGTCRDDLGNSICSVYEFTVKNPNATTAQRVQGSLKVTANSGFSNLSYAVFKGAAASITNYDVNGAAKDTNTASVGDVVVARQKFGDAGDIDTWYDTTNELLAANGGSTTYTVVVWLEEAGNDNNTEQGQTLTASITFDTGTGTGVTGVLSATS